MTEVRERIAKTIANSFHDKHLWDCDCEDCVEYRNEYYETADQILSLVRERVEGMENPKKYYPNFREETIASRSFEQFRKQLLERLK